LSRAAVLLIAALAAAAAGCDTVDCSNNESFVVDENGSCAAAPRRFTLSSISCRVATVEQDGPTGLPSVGALGQDQRPLRQGGFLLYGDVCPDGMASGCPDPAFRLCRSRRVDFRLEVSCVDGMGAPACDATLTEPGP
jgi:hypothetical protein